MDAQTLELKSVYKDGVFIGVQIAIKECQGYMNGNIIYIQTQPLIVNAEYIDKFIDGLKSMTIASTPVMKEQQ